jgi:inner membrane protein
LAIAIHIALDLITIYGTKLWSPLSDTPLRLGIAFDLDPYIALIFGLGFLASLRLRPRPVAAMTLAIFTAYLGLQSLMYWRTLALGETHARRLSLREAKAYALPQPISPFTWKLIVADGDRYLVSHVNYLARQPAAQSMDSGFPATMLAAYRPPDTLRWRRRDRFGDSREEQILAWQVWWQERFSPFRRFAALPALYRIDRDASGEICVWFTDLRHNFPTVPPSFRYGMCRARIGEDWRLYRLRYFRNDDRQSLE